ncbi:hypothetical protein M2475_001413 [Breznakia sp. PF5-3]|uniref:hypothetical protein n=1 Tax=unclassified Breznakia TaxID=2623764 RepID=UPI0024073970|nr:MULTISPECIES: hypothetical protein [unclassified Breznakia]MDF9824968.1 hypothetical protein [Breznakia sp. PM6-1]MDF9835839.1 hypothetical protein [Breznakia sp. PF5-3]MDF9836909.1 hypothetical protein [Breznakia sp. PFB2-8]MDF9859855.1 hypothetical protein [Breznakia sp. PH5-24]
MFGIGKKKAKLKDFINDETKAVIHIYGDKVKVDGKDPSEFDMIKGEYGQAVVKLDAGVHSIEAIHRTTEGKTNIKTPRITSELTLEANHEYSFGIHKYSKEYLDNNSHDSAYQYIYYCPVGEGKYEGRFGIICFIER